MPAKTLTSAARGLFCSVPRQLRSWHLLHHVLLQHVQQLEARLALRLQEAAQRRVSHLDQIKERAAISKEEKEACPPMSPPKTHRGLSCCACCAAACISILSHLSFQPRSPCLWHSFSRAPDALMTSVTDGQFV